LTSGAVTGLIDRLERLGLVERAGDPGDRRKVLVRVRADRIPAIADLYRPLEKAMHDLSMRYSKEELRLLIDFAERGGALMLARTAELNEPQRQP
jgi:DNA-binding MarR family transcriptional regulator